MSFDEFWLFIALFLLIEAALLMVAMPMLYDYHKRGQLGRAALFVSICAIILAVIAEQTVAALMVVAVLQP